MIHRIVPGAFVALFSVAMACRGPAIDPAAHTRLPRSVATTPPGNNWPVPPRETERLLSRAPMQFVSLEPTEQGVAGAMKATVAFPRDGRELVVKWKPLSAGALDGWNNNPRKELATYVMQRWFLDPGDYVVPTIAVRCVPLADYHRVDADAAPSIDGSRCVLGTLSLWLENVEAPEELLDPARFASDPNYAYHLANFNVLTYLVEHRDGRPGNILVAKNDANRRVYAVDNGISFGGLIHNFLTTNWDVVRVPAIRRAVVERLRTVDRDELAALGTLVELRNDAQGILQPVPERPPIDPGKGVRVVGRRVQMGLTADEIAAVSRRLDTLLREVDDGTLRVF